MTDDVPESTRRYVREHRDEFECILKHRSCLKLRAYTEAPLIRGVSEPKVIQVSDDIERKQEAMQIPQLPLCLTEPLRVLKEVRPPFERRLGRFMHMPHLQRLHLLYRRMYERYRLVRVVSRVRERRIRSLLPAVRGGRAIA